MKMSGWSLVALLLTAAVGLKLQERGNFSLSDLPVCSGKLLAKVVGNDHWQCDSLSGAKGEEAENKCSESYDTDSGKTAYMQCKVSERGPSEFNCLATTPCQPPTGPTVPSSCGSLDPMTFGTGKSQFVKIIDWDKGTSANNGVTFDATKDCINDLFAQNGGVWLMEVSKDGTTFHEWSVYKQIQVRDGFDARGYIYKWKSSNNKLNKQFELYSDVNDAISGTSKWNKCNYDDNNAGFGRDCCCRASSKSFEPNKGGGGWGFFAPSKYRKNIRWSKIRFSMPIKPL